MEQYEVLDIAEDEGEGSWDDNGQQHEREYDSYSEGGIDAAEDLDVLWSDVDVQEHELASMIASTGRGGRRCRERYRCRGF